MSRNAVAPDSAEGSFAGLLEHLTRHSRPEAPASQPAANSTSRTSSASVSNSISGSGVRSTTRALVPVTELKAGRGTAMPESMPLSYESALRRHARRSTAANANLDLPTIPPPASALSQPEAAPEPLAASKVTARVSGRSLSRPAIAQPGIKPEKKRPPQAKIRSESRSKLGSKSRPKSRFESRPNAQPSSVASSVARTPPRKSSAPIQHPDDGPGSAAVSPSLAISAPRRRSKLQSSARPDSNAQHTVPSHPVSRRATSATATLANSAMLEGGKALAKVERHELQWNNSAETLDEAATRRTIVSLRLTDGEFLRLKDRASESGISVSAYMRSCIVDADQLRAQVKQALAEMRSLSARPEPSRFPTLVTSSNHGSAAGADWFRLLMRSAAFLLSPLFPFRRSA